MIGQMKIIQSTEAYKMVSIFPDRPNTKRRRRRILGKYGKLVRMEPQAYKTPFGLVVHPLIYRALKDQHND